MVSKLLGFRLYSVGSNDHSVRSAQYSLHVIQFSYRELYSPWIEFVRLASLASGSCLTNNCPRPLLGLNVRIVDFAGITYHLKPRGSLALDGGLDLKSVGGKNSDHCLY